LDLLAGAAGGFLTVRLAHHFGNDVGEFGDVGSADDALGALLDLVVVAAGGFGEVSQAVDEAGKHFLQPCLRFAKLGLDGALAGDDVAQTAFQLPEDAHVEWLVEHLSHQGDLAVQPAVVDDEFADVFEDQVEHALQRFTQGQVVLRSPVETGTQAIQALAYGGRLGIGTEDSGEGVRFGSKLGVRCT
jgi:hypothetical protein